MEKPIARITRDNHLNNLVKNLPLFTFIYALQCILTHFVFSEIVDPSLFAVTLGLTIISVLSYIYIYDRYQHVIVYENKIQLYFELTGQGKTIYFSDIVNIQAPNEECEFASLSLILKDNKQHDLYFIDYPLSVKNFLIQQISTDMGNIDSDLAA